MGIVSLNRAQGCAAYASSRSTLVTAGPGTGKTRTLVARLFHLIESSHSDFSRIAVITFTNKAAAEISERVTHSDINLSSPDRPFIGTFHAFAQLILTRNGKSCSVIEAVDQLNLCHTVQKQYPVFRSAREVATHITKLKNNIESDEIVETYQNLLKLRGVIDFDDLLLMCLDELRSGVQSYHHVLVDEFQDVSLVQYRIVERLYELGAQIFAIGDPDQSIYGFRGGGSEMFERLCRYVPETNIHTLHENYRSSQAVLDAAGGIVASARLLNAQSDADGLVQIVSTKTPISEAQYVVREVGRLVGGTNLQTAHHEISDQEIARFSDIAIISRTHRVRHVLESTLFSSEIPYQVIGAESPFAAPVIVFLIACLKSVETGVHIPIPDFIIRAGVSARDLSTRIASSRAQRSYIDKFNNLYTFFDQKIAVRSLDERLTLMQFAQSMIPHISETSGFSRVFSHYSYLSQYDYYDPTADRVAVMSMHASKGLEFRHVFIVGFEDGLIPFASRKLNVPPPSKLRRTGKSLKSDRASINEDQLEEERRLLYVAITRAKERVYLIHADSRNKQITKVSPFESDLLAGGAKRTLDEEAVRAVKRFIKKRDKKSQMKMF